MNLKLQLRPSYSCSFGRSSRPHSPGKVITLMAENWIKDGKNDEKLPFKSAIPRLYAQIRSTDVQVTKCLVNRCSSCLKCFPKGFSMFRQHHLLSCLMPPTWTSESPTLNFSSLRSGSSGSPTFGFRKKSSRSDVSC